MNYIDIKTREVIGFAELRLKYPNTSIPVDANVLLMEGASYAQLQQLPRPPVTDYQMLAPGEPMLNGNVWQIGWIKQLKPLPDRLALVDGAIEGAIEAQAHALAFNGMADAASYVSSTNALWAAQAQALVAWRDACWTRYDALAADAAAGRGLPLPADVVAGLPAFTMGGE